jgi:hypothetical protein
MSQNECVADEERPVLMRIGRVAAELKMRRRRLDAYQRGPDWPGKQPAWRSELAAYDWFLMLAASMIEVTVPPNDGVPMTPEARAVLEDRLSHAGLDVWGPRVIRPGGCM